MHIQWRTDSLGSGKSSCLNSRHIRPIRLCFRCLTNPSWRTCYRKQLIVLIIASQWFKRNLYLQQYLENNKTISPDACALNIRLKIMESLCDHFILVKGYQPRTSITSKLRREPKRYDDRYTVRDASLHLMTPLVLLGSYNEKSLFTISGCDTEWISNRAHWFFFRITSKCDLLGFGQTPFVSLWDTESVKNASDYCLLRPVLKTKLRQSNKMLVGNCWA